MTTEAGSGGLPVVPFRQFLLKIHRSCNLSCDYCYVYFAADQSWRRRPASMTVDIVRQTADRIAEHAREHRLPMVRVILHGGEPLMVGKAHLEELLTVLAERLAPEVEVRCSMQSNGTLLDEEFLALLHGHRVGVAVSVDGSPAAHDRHRRFADGRPSHARGVGRYADAMESDRDMLRRTRRVFGDGHPRTLSAANNLAVSEFLSGDRQAARDTDREMLKQRREISGPDHRSTLNSATNYARPTGGRGVPGSAEAHRGHAQAQPASARTRASDHPPRLPRSRDPVPPTGRPRGGVRPDERHLRTGPERAGPPVSRPL